MNRRWVLGLVITALVVIIGSGGFASTASVDVPTSNAGVSTVQVQISAPQPLCNEAAESETQPPAVAGGESTDDQVCEQDEAEDNILAPFLENPSE